MPSQACLPWENERYINLEFSNLICLNWVLHLGRGWWIELFILVGVLLLLFIVSCFVHYQVIFDTAWLTVRLALPSLLILALALSQNFLHSQIVLGFL